MEKHDIKVGDRFVWETENYWSGRGQHGLEIQVLEIEITAIDQWNADYKVVRQLSVTDPIPNSQGKGKKITKGGFALVEYNFKRLRKLNICEDCRPPVNDCDSCYESDCDCNLSGHRLSGKK